jgi:3-oxoacyl-[acyl-carrier-protein] synthase-3
VYLHSIGHFHPENVIDNDFLASLEIGVDPDWILRRVGIQTRRTVLPLDYIRSERNRNASSADEACLYTNARTGALAARMALERAHVLPEDVGLVIAGGSAPQVASPAEACAVAAELGIEAPCFDLNSACSSFVVQLWTLSRMDRRRLPDFILLVQPENLTRTVDYTDKTNAVLMGDASTAAIVSLTVKSAVRIVFTTMHCRPEAWKHCVIPARGHFRQDGLSVQRFAITKMSEVVRGLSDHVGPDSYFIGHQSNLKMLQAVCERLGIRHHKHLYNVDRFGNCGSAGAPSVLSENWNRFRDNDHLRLAVVGAGLTWGGVSMRFNRVFRLPREEDIQSRCGCSKAFNDGIEICDVTSSSISQSGSGG